MRMGISWLHTICDNFNRELNVSRSIRCERHRRKAVYSYLAQKEVVFVLLPSLGRHYCVAWVQGISPQAKLRALRRSRGCVPNRCPDEAPPVSNYYRRTDEERSLTAVRRHVWEEDPRFGPAASEDVENTYVLRPEAREHGIAAIAQLLATDLAIASLS